MNVHLRCLRSSQGSLLLPLRWPTEPCPSRYWSLVSFSSGANPPHAFSPRQTSRPPNHASVWTEKTPTEMPRIIYHLLDAQQVWSHTSRSDSWQQGIIKFRRSSTVLTMVDMPVPFHVPLARCEAMSAQKVPSLYPIPTNFNKAIVHITATIADAHILVD